MKEELQRIAKQKYAPVFEKWEEECREAASRGESDCTCYMSREQDNDPIFLVALELSILSDLPRKYDNFSLSFTFMWGTVS